MNNQVQVQVQQQQVQVERRLSARRWLILVGICIYGFLNGFVNEITAILSTLTELLGLQLDQWVYLSQIFNYIKPLASMPSAWFVDKFGIRQTMYLALGVTIVRNCSRALLFSPQLGAGWQKMKFLYWTLSSISESLVIVIYFTCLPLKVSESWFPQRERSFAWSSIYIVPFMGASLAAYLLPRIIVDADSIQLLANLNLACLLVSVVVVVLTVTRSTPSGGAPSERSELAEAHLRQGGAGNFIMDLKQVLGSFAILLQLVTMCTFEAMNASIKSLLQDVLGSLGLSSKFCGNLLALNSLMMIVMQLIGSYFMDKRQRATTTTRTVKRLVALQWLTFMVQLASIGLGRGYLESGQSWPLILGAFLLHSSMSCWSAPYYNDTLASLTTGRLSHSTISAVRLSFYILLNNPYQSLFVYLRQVDHSTRTQQSSYSLSLTFAALMVTAVSLVYLSCFSSSSGKSTPAAIDDESSATTTRRREAE